MRIKSCGRIRSMLMYADGVDWILMALGLIGAIGDGFITPIVFFITSILLNNLSVSSFKEETFMHTISKRFINTKIFSALSFLIDRWYHNSSQSKCSN